MKAIHFIKQNTKQLVHLLTVMFILHSVYACAQTQEADNDDKTLSPYFTVINDESGNPKLPLKSTHAEVNIAGVIADVQIIQEYQNTGDNPIEAIYVFPASTRAAVYNMKMTIGEREIVAIVQKKQKARANYEQAKQEGKSASLLEQHRPNVFQMNVANIMPGDVIKVALSYTELLIPENGIYEFVYPTVVGPRYSESNTDDYPADEQWITNPYTRESINPIYGFDIDVHIAAGLPLHDVRCKTHEVDIQYSGKNQANIALKNIGGKEGNRDYVLQYRLQGNQIESGLLLFEGKDENFFLAMMQPPKRVEQDEIPPREYIFILDISGSMSGFPLDVSKELMRNLLGKLKPVDRFNVMTFAGSSGLLSETSLPATPKNINNALNSIKNLRGSGGTRLLPALQKALSLKGTENYVRSFVIATDGYVTVEKEAFKLIRANLDKANFFSFGIGSSVNRFIIEGMAHAGCGEAFIVLNQSKAHAKANKLMEYIQSPVLTNIRVGYDGFDVYDVEPISVPDILAQRPVILYGKWKGTPSGTIRLTGTSGKGSYKKNIFVHSVSPDDKNSAIRYLWARQKIRVLDDFMKVSHNEEHEEDITQLGLKYNLLTAYTSFIAIDSEARNTTGQVSTVQQPLPLPQGVSNAAVGYASYAAPSGTSKYRKSLEPVMNNVAVESNFDINIKEEEKEAADMAFIVVEKMPEFKHKDFKDIHDFIKHHITYPKHLAKKRIEGTVYIRFIINKDGTVGKVQVVRGVHPDLDNEAARVIKLTSTHWIPGKQRGIKVNVSYTIPVKFKR